MKFLRKVLPYLPVIMLGYFSLEILFRRWVFGQEPAQVTAGFTYLLLIVNLGYILFAVGRRRTQ